MARLRKLLFWVLAGAVLVAGQADGRAIVAAQTGSLVQPSTSLAAAPRTGALLPADVGGRPTLAARERDRQQAPGRVKVLGTLLALVLALTGARVLAWVLRARAGLARRTAVRLRGPPVIDHLLALI